VTKACIGILSLFFLPARHVTCVVATSRRKPQLLVHLPKSSLYLATVSHEYLSSAANRSGGLTTFTFPEDESPASPLTDVSLKLFHSVAGR